MCVCGLIRIQGNIIVIHVYSRRQKKVPVPFPFPFRFRSIPILFRSTTVQRNVLLTVRVPFCFVMGSVKESSAVFIDCTKQFFYSQRYKTSTMSQLIKKEGVTASEAKLGHLMMQRGWDEARRQMVVHRLSAALKIHLHSLYIACMSFQLLAISIKTPNGRSVVFPFTCRSF